MLATGQPAPSKMHVTREQAAGLPRTGLSAAAGQPGGRVIELATIGGCLTSPVAVL